MLGEHTLVHTDDFVFAVDSPYIATATLRFIDGEYKGWSFVVREPEQGVNEDEHRMAAGRTWIELLPLLAAKRQEIENFLAGN
jgi:hypothetical protein